MYRSTFALAAISLATLSAGALRGAESDGVSLKHAAPAEVHMAVYAMHNDERDYQRKYYADAWATFQEEQIGKRMLSIVTSQVEEDDLEEMESAWSDVCEALKPLDTDALLDATEVLFVQKMAGPAQQSVVVLRMPADGAEGFEDAIIQILELAVERSDGKVGVERSTTGDDVEVTRLAIHPDVPMEPCVARVADVVFVGTHPTLLEASIAQFQDDAAHSKFDDPRFVEALKHLPEPEDALTVFDGRQLFEDLHGIGEFIREKKPNNEKAERAARIMDRVIEEVAVIDYEVCVEYSEEGQNRVAALGKLAPNAESTLIGRAIMSGQAFEDWQSWVPAEATAYSLSTGINLHVLYDGIIKLVREEIPESHDALERWEEVQDKVGVHLDRDILQSFSGESVCVTLPVAGANGSETQQSVTALRCDNPDRIAELIERAVEGLHEFPAVKSQRLELVDCEQLEGFKEVRASLLQVTGVKPVYGFHDGWMIISSHRDAAAQLVAVRAGEAPAIDRAASLQQFDLDDAGKSIYAVRYTDVGAGVRQAADMIEKAGMMAPMVLGMAAANADPEDIKPIQEGLALLPSIAKVVRKFDFYEQRLSIMHQGPLPETYQREAVTLVRYDEDAAEE